jgi:glutaminyl-tRNA synthetase
VGVAKADSIVDGALLEHCVREDLSGTAPRAMAVLDPVKVTLSNWPEGRVEQLIMENHPERPEMGERAVNFARALYIEREDFMEDPPKKFFRLSPGREARLKGAYIIKCEEAIKDEAGNIAELVCSVDLSSKSGGEGASRKVKATLHWLSAIDARPIEARLYEPILNDEGTVAEELEIDGEEAAATQRPAKDFLSRLNPDSMKVMQNALAEPIIADAAIGETFQFLRLGYFCKDPDSTPELPVYNRTVALKDSWAKVKQDI